MVQDTSRGSVRAGPHPDSPIIRYHMNGLDFARFLRGIETLAKIYLAAGAKEVIIPGPQRHTVIRSEAELSAFLCRDHKPTDFLMSAYHPLGTARMASTIADGVCDSDLRVFGWHGLIRPNASHFLDLATLAANEEIVLDELVLEGSCPMIGKSLRDLRVRELHQVSVVALRRADGTVMAVPGAETVLTVGDIVIVVGTPEGVRGFAKMLGIGRG